jgi:hypothetical protein
MSQCELYRYTQDENHDKMCGRSMTVTCITLAVRMFYLCSVCLSQTIFFGKLVSAILESRRKAITAWYSRRQNTREHVQEGLT